MGTPKPLDTPEKIDAVMRSLAEEMPGWVPPVAYGVTLVSPKSLGTSNVRFPVVNVGVHGFPALALSKVTGRIDQTATYEITRAGLNRAVDIVAPAEAATMYQHPNLKSWRRILNDLEDASGSRIFAVFIAALDDPISSPYDEALRRQVAEGERAELYR